MVRRGFSPFACVYTRADTSPTTGTRFFPMTAAMGTANIKAIRALMDVINITGDTHLTFGYLESDELEIFSGAATPLDANFSRTTDGCSGTTAYTSVAFTKAYVVLGVITRNNNAGSPKIELAWVSTRFDTRSC